MRIIEERVLKPSALMVLSAKIALFSCAVVLDRCGRHEGGKIVVPFGHGRLVGIPFNLPLLFYHLLPSLTKIKGSTDLCNYYLIKE